MSGLLLATTSLGMESLDLSGGAPKEVLGHVTEVAWELFGVSVVLGLLVEAFGGSPEQPKSYGGVAWRTVVVAVLLRSYAPLLGSVVATTQAVAEKIAPQAQWDEYGKFQEERLRASCAVQRDASTLPDVSAPDSFWGGQIFDGLLVLVVAIGHALQWAFRQLTQILIAFFYCLGPLPLVFAIPRGLGVAGGWFRTFVTVACWPVCSALLLALSSRLALHGGAHLHSADGSSATAFGALASTILLVALNLGVPFLAAAIVGGAVQNVFAPTLRLAQSGALLAAGAMVAGKAGKGRREDGPKEAPPARGAEAERPSPREASAAGN